MTNPRTPRDHDAAMYAELVRRMVAKGLYPTDAAAWTAVRRWSPSLLVTMLRLHGLV